MTPLYVFDDGKGLLGPLTDLRPVFGVRTGALTTLERIRLALRADPAGLFVPGAIAPLAGEQHKFPINPPPAPGTDALLINGRAPLAVDLVERLTPGSVLIEEESGEPIAALVPVGQIESVLEGRVAGFKCEALAGHHFLSRPWHIRTFRDAAIARDLALLAPAPSRDIPAGVVHFGRERLTIDPAAHVFPTAVFDLERGPVVVAEGAVVRPGAIVIGPAYIGQGSTVLEHAVIRAHTAIGPRCKVAGEVSGTIFQGHANKAHEGHLGDSWIGEWCNLGAGTTNSNLLNTYADVIAKAIPGGAYEATGQQFLGAIIADHVKTAISTRLMTGLVVHTGAMLAESAAVAGCIPPFAWRTDNGHRTFRLNKFLDVARTVMARRNVQPSVPYIERLTALHAAAPS